MKLDGKIAVITGTSSNIGAGLAEGMADAGATIVCVDSKARKRLGLRSRTETPGRQSAARDLRRHRRGAGQIGNREDA